MAKTKVILDVDTGTDDAIAVMLAVLHEDIEVIAVTTVDGNVRVDVAAENTLRVLQHVGRQDVPVFRGASEPIAGWESALARDQMRENDMHGTYLDLPPATCTPNAEPAAAFLARYFTQPGAAGIGDTTLIATGPLTNVALAMKLESRMRESLRTLVVMGGGHEIPSVNASAEFNFWVDPEAAHVVLTSGVERIVVVPLDATHQALVSAEDCEDFRRADTPAGLATAAFVERRIASHSSRQPLSRPATAAVHDALCVAYVIDPKVVDVERHWIDVETSGRLTVGRSVIDTHHRQGLEPNAWVAFAADECRFVDLLKRTFSGRRNEPRERG